VIIPGSISRTGRGALAYRTSDPYLACTPCRSGDNSKTPRAGHLQRTPYPCTVTGVSAFTQEVRSQPEVWRQVAKVAAELTQTLPGESESVRIIGCGTSLFMGQAYSAYRQRLCRGWTEVYPASEVPPDRGCDLVIALSRSGTTTEVLQVVEDYRRRGGTPVLAITADRAAPLASLASRAVVLDFADEQAIVQSRFATTALLLLLAGCGWDVPATAARAEASLRFEVPSSIEKLQQFVFIGRGIGVGLANEAALKLRECAQVWSESYPAMEMRHGPMSVVGSNSLVWSLDPMNEKLREDVESTGASVLSGGEDPIAELIRIQLVAAHLAAARGLNPDAPVHLTRSVVLE